jgi:hypothetical protein
VAHVDLLPTLCRIAGVENPESKTLPLDGMDVTPLLFAQDDFEMPERNLFIWRNPGTWSIRTRRYRATETTLHDLIEDPGQKTNLARIRPEIHGNLIEAYRDWAAEATDEEPVLLPVPIGYEEWPTVTLKAHELDIYPGMGKGIDYCGRQGFANQWIDRWSDPKAYAARSIKVVSSGRYRVRLRYACPEDGVGSVFRLSAGSASLDIRVQDPWVSAPHAAAEQVIRNHGSFLSREWKDMDAGELVLEKGTHSLELRVVKKPGMEMPDIKALIFERL